MRFIASWRVTLISRVYLGLNRFRFELIWANQRLNSITQNGKSTGSVPLQKNAQKKTCFLETNSKRENNKRKSVSFFLLLLWKFGFSSFREKVAKSNKLNTKKNILFCQRSSTELLIFLLQFSTLFKMMHNLYWQLGTMSYPKTCLNKFGYKKPTLPERMYNSHYGNGVPAMFIS